MQPGDLVHNGVEVELVVVSRHLLHRARRRKHAAPGLRKMIQPGVSSQLLQQQTQSWIARNPTNDHNHWRSKEQITI